MDVAHAILLYGKIDFSRLTADYLSAKFELLISASLRPAPAAPEAKPAPESWLMSPPIAA